MTHSNEYHAKRFESRRFAADAVCWLTRASKLMNHRPCVRKTHAVLLAFGLWSLSLSAHALSCLGVDDRFFAQCANGRCTVVFRARDIPVPGGCARRTVVEAVPAEVGDFVLRRVSNALVSGAYEITLTHRYYAKPPVSAAELDTAFSAHELKVPLVRVGRTASGASIDQLREDWTARARWSTVKLLAYWAIDFALLVGGLYALYRTSATFRQRLREVPRRSLARPIAVQLVLFVLAVLSLGSPTGPVLLGLVAPVILGAWVFELGSYIWVRYRLKAAHEF